MTKYTSLRFYKTRVIAEDILAHMMDLAAKKGYVTVNEYFEISGLDDAANEGDKWCWRYDKIDSAEILKAHNGWFINLGDPIRIEKPKNTGAYVQQVGCRTYTDLLYDIIDDARSVLSCMIDIANEYGSVSLNDYLELSGCDDCYTHIDDQNKIGWTSQMLEKATIVRTPHGYKIDLMEPIDIENEYGSVYLKDYLELSARDRCYTHKPKRHCGKHPFGYDSNTIPAILIDHAEESIQNYIKYGNLNNLKAARDILITAIIELEDEESEEK